MRFRYNPHAMLLFAPNMNPATKLKLTKRNAATIDH
jgi:hypothetical protein